MATHISELAADLPTSSDADALLRQLPIGIVVAEAPSGRVVLTSERAQDMWNGALPPAESVDDYSSGYTGFRSNGRQYAADEWPLARALQHAQVVVDEEIELLMPSGERRVFLVSASPILDDGGAVIRAIAVFHDVTDQRQDERRREFIMDLGDELRTLDDAAAIAETAVVATGEHLCISSVSYADVDDAAEYALVNAEYRNGRVAPTGTYYLEDFGPELIVRLRAGEPVIVEDLDEMPQPHAVFEGWGIRSILVVPIARQGRLLALFSVLHTAPRAWTRSEVSLVTGVAERTWHAVNVARTQAELRRNREWLGLALRAGSAAIWEWDLRSGEICWSEEGDALLGAATLRNTLTFGRWVALVHPKDRAEAKAVARRLSTMREGEFVFEYRLAGEPRWIHMRGRIVADPGGVPARVVGVAVDSTAQKNEELERERLLSEAHEASEAKSHFIGVISHEFRTPLTAIIGYADLLSTGVSGTLTPAQARQLDRVRSCAWHLTQMVDEILTFSRLEAGRERVNLETTDITALARETCALIAPAAAAKDLALACELPDTAVVLRTDSGKVRQILLNLLGNAVKFTARGGVTLRVRRADGALSISVIDTGPGIEKDNLERIFDRFWQEGQTSAHTASGAGLGLTVSRRLAELLGGTLVVQSTPGTGSTFTLDIPA